MTDDQAKRVHDILYSTDSRTELAERIVMLEDLVAESRSSAKSTTPVMTELLRFKEESNGREVHYA